MSMMTLTVRGDHFPLHSKASLDVQKSLGACQTRTWVQYNPTKNIARWGLPITSRDGTEDQAYEINGLHSLREMFGMDVVGNDVEGLFNQLTPLAYEIGFDTWAARIFGVNYQEYLGRCHFIKLDAGGFFPPHRDGNTTIPVDEDYFRLFVPIQNCQMGDMVWLQDGRQLIFTEGMGTPYFINTLKSHSVFSFKPDCIFVVLNIKARGASRVLLHLGTA